MMHFVFFHIPQGQSRPRFAHNHVYDPLSSQKKTLKWEVVSQMQHKGYLKLHNGPISAEVRVYTKKPKSLSKSKKKNLFWNIVKYDLDNYVKYYLDVLNGLAYHDDKLISELTASKIYSDTPRVEITLYTLRTDMLNEHAITICDEITRRDIEYLVKKANRLGLMGRTIHCISEEIDDEGKHFFFQVDDIPDKRGD